MSRFIKFGDEFFIHRAKTVVSGTEESLKKIFDNNILILLLIAISDSKYRDLIFGQPYNSMLEFQETLDRQWDSIIDQNISIDLRDLMDEQTLLALEYETPIIPLNTILNKAIFTSFMKLISTVDDRQIFSNIFNNEMIKELQEAFIKKEITNFPLTKLSKVDTSSFSEEQKAAHNEREKAAQQALYLEQTQKFLTCKVEFIVLLLDLYLKTDLDNFKFTLLRQIPHIHYPEQPNDLKQTQIESLFGTIKQELEYKYSKLTDPKNIESLDKNLAQSLSTNMCLNGAVSNLFGLIRLFEGNASIQSIKTEIIKYLTAEFLKIKQILSPNDTGLEIHAVNWLAEQVIDKFGLDPYEFRDKQYINLLPNTFEGLFNEYKVWIAKKVHVGLVMDKYLEGEYFQQDTYSFQELKKYYEDNWDLNDEPVQPYLRVFEYDPVTYDLRKRENFNDLLPFHMVEILSLLKRPLVENIQFNVGELELFDGGNTYLKVVSNPEGHPAKFFADFKKDDLNYLLAYDKAQNIPLDNLFYDKAMRSLSIADLFSFLNDYIANVNNEKNTCPQEIIKLASGVLLNRPFPREMLNEFHIAFSKMEATFQKPWLRYCIEHNLEIYLADLIEVEGLRLHGFHLCCEFGHLSYLQRLHQRNYLNGLDLDKDIPDLKERPLNVAIAKGHDKLVEFLITPTKNGINALEAQRDLVSKQNDSAEIEIEHNEGLGLTPNVPSQHIWSNNISPIQIAIMFNKPAIWQMLLQHPDFNLNPDICNADDLHAFACGHLKFELAWDIAEMTHANHNNNSNNNDEDEDEDDSPINYLGAFNGRSVLDILIENNQLDYIIGLILLERISVDACALDKSENEDEPEEDTHGDLGTLLYMAILDNKIAMALALLRLGACPNWTHPVTGDSVLIKALKTNDLNLLNAILAPAAYEGWGTTDNILEQCARHTNSTYTLRNKTLNEKTFKDTLYYALREHQSHLLSIIHKHAPDVFDNFKVNPLFYAILHAKEDRVDGLETFFKLCSDYQKQGMAKISVGELIDMIPKKKKGVEENEQSKLFERYKTSLENFKKIKKAELQKSKRGSTVTITAEEFAGLVEKPLTQAMLKITIPVAAKEPSMLDIQAPTGKDSNKNKHRWFSERDVTQLSNQRSDNSSDYDPDGDDLDTIDKFFKRSGA